MVSPPDSSSSPPFHLRTAHTQLTILKHSLNLGSCTCPALSTLTSNCSHKPALSSGTTHSALWRISGTLTCHTTHCRHLPQGPLKTDMAIVKETLR